MTSHSWISSGQTPPSTPPVFLISVCERWQPEWKGVQYCTVFTLAHVFSSVYPQVFWEWVSLKSRVEFVLLLNKTLCVSRPGSRLFPVLPGNGRITQDDLVVGGYFIPKGVRPINVMFWKQKKVQWVSQKQSSETRYNEIWLFYSDLNEFMNNNPAVSSRPSWLCATTPHPGMKRTSPTPPTFSPIAGCGKTPQTASTPLARFPSATASGAASAGESRSWRCI